MAQYHILVVDDEEDNLFLLKRTLEREYRVTMVYSAEEALEILAVDPVDLLLADNRLPGQSGVELCTTVARRWPDTMRLIVTGFVEVKDLFGAINEGHVYQYITKPWDAPQLKLTVRRALEAFEQGVQTKRLVSRLWTNFNRLKDNHLHCLIALVCAVEAKDKFMAGHSQRVRDMSRQLGQEIGLCEAYLNSLSLGALLHDLGTHWVSAEILNKQGELDEEERAAVRRHSEIGANLLDYSHAFDEVREIIGSHQEWWNGEGFPAGLSKEDIPVGARIVAICEAFDALTSHRPHRPAFDREKAVEMVASGAGTQFDPNLVEHFVAMDWNHLGRKSESGHLV